MKTLSLIIGAALAAATLHATPFTFDVDRPSDFGTGWFTIDVPETWADIDWPDLRGPFYLLSTASEGSYSFYSGHNPPQLVATASWAGVQLELFSEFGMPTTTNAGLFAWLDGINLPQGSVYLGRISGDTPLDAILRPGVTLRAQVPDTGSTLLMLFGTLAMLIPLHRLKA